MAVQEGPQHFVEEIDYKEIQRLQVVGKGSFGVVWKGRWKERVVAVKHIDTEAERKAFAVEVRQLSRVAHPNIVRLYGACTRDPVCLVMEYAEGGSLYNVLHGHQQPKYTAAHAMSWSLQCARGVAYLHEMKPKALIHRDLKPPNLLLIMGGKVLKICDFGTACDKQTHMTNNKGSAAWMAPEVFEGCSYTEKCDVFSWSIILWEVLTRRKPFDEIGGPAFRIMWAVHIGRRPPPIRGCPPPIERIMTRCWDKNPNRRPSMQEVVRVMAHLCQFFKGADEPILYDQSGSDSEKNIPTESIVGNTFYEEEEDELSFGSPNESETQVSSSMNGYTPQSPTAQQPILAGKKPLSPLEIEVEKCLAVAGESEDLLQKAAAAAASPDDLPPEHTVGPPSLCLSPAHPPVCHLPPSGPIATVYSSLAQGALLWSKREQGAKYQRHSEETPDLTEQPTKNLGHKRSLSSGTPVEVSALGLSEQSSDSDERVLSSRSNWLAGGLGAATSRSLYDIRDVSGAFDLPSPADSSSSGPDANTQDLIENAYLMLDPQLHPISPSASCEESMRIFEEHKRMAQDYLKVQTELALLTKYKHGLAEQLSEAEGLSQLDDQDSARYKDELRQLQSEKESLVQLHRNLKRQLEIIKSAQQKKQRGGQSAGASSEGEDEWVMVQRS